MTRSLEDLKRNAKLDLGKPTKDAHLRWIFWHAEAVGRHEVARMALDEMNLWHRSVKSMLMSTLNPAMHDAWKPGAPTPAQLGLAQDELVDSAACVQACAHILSIMDCIGERMRLTPLAVVRPGQVSQARKAT